MKKRFFIPLAALVIMCILFIIGLTLIFTAPSIGENAGESFIKSQGGTYFPEQVNRIIVSTTRSYQLGGLVIALVGGLGILINGYSLYKET